MGTYVKQGPFVNVPPGATPPLDSPDFDAGVLNGMDETLAALGITSPPALTYTDLQAAADAAAANGTKLVSSGVLTTGSTLTLNCDADLSGLTYNYSGTGTAVLVGNPAIANFRKTLRLPHVIATAKTTTGWGQVVGSVGVDVVNAYAFHITVPNVRSFETGLRVRGDTSNGTQQTTFHLGHLDNNKVNVRFTGSATGWANQDCFFGGRCSHNSNEGAQVAGTRHVLFELLANPVNGHQFFGTSLESPNVVEYHIEAAQTTWCTFWGARFENTGGDANRRILNTGASKNNRLMGGAYAENMTQVVTSPALPFDIDTNASTTRRGGTTTSPAVLLENVTSNTAPVLAIMAAGAGGAGTAPATGYAGWLTANKWSGKRSTDSFNRFELDVQNGRVYLGDASAAPVAYLGGSASALFVGGGVPVLPLTTDAQDLGSAGLRWRDLHTSRYVRIGSIYLRDNAGVLEKSTDGTTWTPV